ncbi:uncharacterized protein TNCV_3649721 [Trichonephila clavipes]|nr:uncharacterized protein TNCV_3649721 [Trichonephila clavipes]
MKASCRQKFHNRDNCTSRVARDTPWCTLCKKSHGIPSSPRAAAVAKFRLLTGHDCLCAHLFRFNLVTSPICVLCDTGQDMTAAHLDECSALNDLNCSVKRHVPKRKSGPDWKCLIDFNTILCLKEGVHLAVVIICHLHQRKMLETNLRDDKGRFQLFRPVRRDLGIFRNVIMQGPMLLETNSVIRTKTKRLLISRASKTNLHRNGMQEPGMTNFNLYGIRSI